MLEILVKGGEMFDDESETFFTVGDAMLNLEHSLISISKWESKWKKPFLSKNEKTAVEILSYIECMSVTPIKDRRILLFLTNEHFEKVNTYINDSMTATTFKDSRVGAARSNGELVTSELIYYWMCAFGIPQEYQKWHINRLLTLIKVCSIKNQPQKKMSRNDIYRHNNALNRARLSRAHKKG